MGFWEKATGLKQLQLTDANAYQQNLSTPVSDNLSYDTTRGVLGIIRKAALRSPDQALKVYNQFKTLQQDSTSTYYNPYASVTNKAVSNFQSYGGDVSNINDDWFNQYSYLTQYLTYDGTTNNPSKPGKKATTLQKAAYEYYQIYQSEATTKKAETEWSSLKNELTYWAQRKDRNYSDDEIISRIDWSKYPTLSKMDSTKAMSPVELNRSVDYSKDNMYGVLWAARNKTTGSMDMDTACSATGEGISWKEDKTIRDKLNFANKDTYSPYSVGMTLEDEGLYFGQASFDQDWLDNNRQYGASNDATAKKMYANVAEAEEYTQKLESQKEKLDSDIEYMLKYYDDADTILDLLKSDTTSYSDLFALDKTLDTGSLKKTTRAVDYRWQDIEAKVREKCDEKQARNKSVQDFADDIMRLTNPENDTIETAKKIYGASDSARAGIEEVKKTGEDLFSRVGADTKGLTEGARNGVEDVEQAVSAAPAAMSIAGLVDQANKDVEKKMIQKAGPAILKFGTPAEKAALETITSNAKVVAGVTDLLRNAVGNFPKAAVKSGTSLVVGQYLDSLSVVSDYKEHDENLTSLKSQLESVKDEITNLSSAASVGSMTKEQYDDLMRFKGDTNNYYYKVLQNEPKGSELRTEALQTLYSFITAQDWDMLTPDQQAEAVNTAEDWWGVINENSPIDQAILDGNKTGDETDEIGVDMTAVDGRQLTITLERGEDGTFSFLEAIDAENGDIVTRDKDEADELLGYTPKTFLSADDQERLNSVLPDKQRELQEQIATEEAYLAANKELYEDEAENQEYLIDTWSQLKAFAEANGTELDSGLPVKLSFVHEYLNSKAETQYLPYALLDYAVQSGEMTKEASVESAGTYATNAQKTADIMRETLSELDELGIEITDEQRSNYESHIAAFEKAGKSAAYVALEGNEDFAERAAAGKAKAESEDADQWSKAVATGKLEKSTLEQALRVVGNSASRLEADLSHDSMEDGIKVMTDDEKNRYYYLLDKDGQSAALAYLVDMTDPDTGALTVRSSIERQNAIKEYASTNGFTAAISTLVSFPDKVLGTGLSIAKRIGYRLEGKTASPYNIHFATTQAAEAKRTGSKEFLGKVVGEDLKPVTDTLYDVGVGIGDFAISSKIAKGAGALFKGLAPKVSAWGSKLIGETSASGILGAETGTLYLTGGEAVKNKLALSLAKNAAEVVPLSLASSNDTYLRVLTQTGDPDKALAMSTVDFATDMVSHTVVMKGIHSALASNPSATKSGFQAFMGTVLKNGVAASGSTLATETINMYAERALLDEDSQWGQRVQKYKNAGYSDSMAEQAAEKDMWSGVIRSTMKSFVTSAIRTSFMVGGKAVKEAFKNKTPEGMVSLPESVTGGKKTIQMRDKVNRETLEIKGITVDENTGSLCFVDTQGRSIPAYYFVTDDANMFRSYMAKTSRGENPGGEIRTDKSGSPYAFRSVYDEVNGRPYYDDAVVTIGSTEYNALSWAFKAVNSYMGDMEAASTTYSVPKGSPQATNGYATPATEERLNLGLITVQPAKPTEADLSAQKDITILSGAYGSNAPVATAGLSAVLTSDDPDKSQAASQALISMSDTNTAISAVQGIVTSTDNDVKEDIIQAALTPGSGNLALKTLLTKIKKGGTVTTDDVSAIQSGIAEDRADPNFTKTLTESVNDFMVANAELPLLANPSFADKLAMKAAALQKANGTLSQAQDKLEAAQTKAAAVSDNLSTVTDEYLEDPAGMAAPMEQTTYQLGAAIKEANAAQDLVQKATESVTAAQTDLSTAQQEVLHEVRTQATQAVAEKQAAKAAVAETKAAEEFQTALSTYTPQVAFTAPIKVSTTSGGSVALTGIFGVDQSGNRVYSTVNGYISDKELEDIPDESLPVYDAAVDKMGSMNANISPAYWFPHSLKATTESGEELTLIGIAGTNDGGYNPVVMDDKGKIWDSQGLYMKPDPLTGADGTEVLMTQKDDASSSADLPDIPYSSIYTMNHPETSFPEGFKVNRYGSTGMTDWINNQDVAIVGYTYDNDTGLSLVTDNGESIPVTNFTGGTLSQSDEAESVIQDMIAAVAAAHPEWNVATNSAASAAEDDDDLLSLWDADSTPADTTTTDTATTGSTATGLKPWQDPKYHGKVSKTLKKDNPKSKDFKSWFLSKMAPEALPYLTNADGSPKVFFRGFGSFGSYMYTQMTSPSTATYKGKKMYKNFFFDNKDTAATYAGTDNVVKFRDIKNWETAKAGMQDLGMDLVEAEDPHGSGKMGYQVMHIKSDGSMTPAHGKQSTWFAEDDLDRFRKTYGGNLQYKGIHAGFVTMSKPMIVDGYGCNWDSIPASVTAPDGAVMSGTHHTDAWANWAFAHGFDGIIFDHIMDNASGYGAVGLEVITSQPEQFKSIWNNGNYGKTNPNMLAYIAPKKNAVPADPTSKYKKLATLMGTADVSDKYKELIRRMADNGEMVSKEEWLATDEIKKTRELMQKDSSLDWMVYVDAGDALKSGDITRDEYIGIIENSLAEKYGEERVQEDREIVQKMLATGSYQEYEGADGKLVKDYSGPVEQEKTVYMLVGLPATGKSKIADPLSRAVKARIADNDDAKALHSGSNGGIDNGSMHAESSFIHDRVIFTATENGDNIILPIIGQNDDQVNTYLSLFKDKGYKVHLWMTDLPQSKAIGRAMDRYASKGKYIDVDYLYSVDPSLIRANYDKLKEEGVLDGYAIWSTDVPQSSNPTILDISSPDESPIFTGEGSTTPGAVENGQNGLGSGNDKGSAVSDGLQALRIGGRTASGSERHARKIKTKLQSPQRIANTLFTSMGVGQYSDKSAFRNLDPAIRGYWDTHSQAVAVRGKELGEYTVTMHEAGHAIMQKLGMNGLIPDSLVTALISEEPGFALSYSPNQLKGEAGAEFFWRYLESDEKARNFAGDDFTDLFERNLIRNPGLNKAVKEARNQLQQWINATTDERVAAMVRYEKSETKTNMAKAINTATAWLVDKSAAAEPVDAFVKEALGVDKLPFSQSIRQVSLFSNHTQKRVKQTLTDSLVDPDGKIVGLGLGARLADINFKGTKDDIKVLDRYMLYRHAPYRDAQGKPIFGSMSLTDIEAAKTEIERTRPDIVAAADVVDGFRTDFLQTYMVDEHFWEQVFFDHLQDIYPHYAPTFRVMDTKSGLISSSGGSKKYTLHEATGGSQDIYSPFYSIIAMVDQISAMVANNRVARVFDKNYETVEGMGIFGQRIPDDEETGVNTEGSTELNSRQKQLMDVLNGEVTDDLMQKVLEITKSRPGVNQVKENDILTVTREDGTVVKYKIENPELYKLLSGYTGSDGGKALNILMESVGKLTRTMSMLTTGSNPLFAARNVARDYQNVIHYTQVASNYITGAPKWLKSFWEVAQGKSEDIKNYRAMGGGGWTRINAGSAKSMGQLRDEMFGVDTSTVGGKIKKAVKTLTNLVTLEKFNGWAEEASRFMVYKYDTRFDKSTAEGKQSAFLAAQEGTVDFSRAGNAVLASVLKKTVPFFGASLNGVYRTGRQFTKNERDMVGKRVLKTIINRGLASALGAALISKFCTDEEKEEYFMLSDSIKSNHLILPNPLKGNEGEAPFIRIPLDQDPLGYAVHNAVTNAMMNGSTDEYAIALSATVDTILDNLNPLGSGTIAQPFIDVSHNRTWYGSNIVRNSMSDWTDKTGQYNEDTPNSFKWLGNLLNTSPEVVEYLAQQYTGFVGQLAIPALTLDSNGNIGGFDSLMNSIKKKWTADPASSNDVTKNFYNYKSTLSTITGEAKQNRPQGLLLRSLTQDQVDAAYEEASEMTKSGGIVYETSKLITDTYTQIDAVNGNSALTDAQKTALTRQLKLDMLKSVQAANDELEVFNKKYITGETLTDHVFGAIQKRFSQGATAHIKTAEEKMPQTFKDDSSSTYMERVMSIYNGEESEGYQKEAALPHPQQSFTVTEKNGNKTDCTVADDDWDRYTSVYKAAYESYILSSEKGKRWDTLTDEEKYTVLKSAHSAGQKKIRELYALENGLTLK